MDTKRQNDSIYLQQLFEMYHHKFRNQKFAVIVSSDNNAFDFLRQHRNQLFPETPVVFCGVSNFHDNMLVNQELFTGIVEDVDFKRTLEIAHKLHPKVKKLLFLVATHLPISLIVTF